MTAIRSVGGRKVLNKIGPPDKDFGTLDVEGPQLAVHLQLASHKPEIIQMIVSRYSQAAALSFREAELAGM